MNRLALAAPLALSLVAAAATAAHAQVVPPPPPPSGDPVLSSSGYPLALVDRPLVLPSGMLEVDGHFWIPTSDGIDLFDVVTMTVAGRYSTGTVEPFAGLELLLIQPDGGGGETLWRMFAGARAPVGPGAARATVSRYSPLEGFSTLTFDGRFEYKQKVGGNLAVVAEGGAFLSLLSADFGGTTETGNALGLVGRGAGQVQVAPAAAIQGGLELQIPVSSSDNVTTDTVTVLFGEGLYALDKLDIFARLEITIAGDSDTTAFVVGVLARPL